FQQMMSKNSSPNKKLPFNTNVVATIRTEDNEPVYSKLYPFPMGASDFVNREIKDILKNGIIRPSRSPYNNPIWVVGKKGIDNSGSPNKRLVVDFRKLSLKTVADRYPMPSISMILAKLGRAKFFKNCVADALSRQNINALQSSAASDQDTIHSEESSTLVIEATEKPLNCFQNQIVLQEASTPNKRMFIVFGTKTRHQIDFTDRESLLELVKVTPNVVNALHCKLPDLARILDSLVRLFPSTKFWHC
ncbi:hypothetical protein KR059_007851, partial [Drosophila kikkawai]